MKKSTRSGKSNDGAGLLRSAIFATLMLTLAAGLSACGGGGSDDKVDAITLSPATARLAPGGIQAFTAVLDGGCDFSGRACPSH